MDNAKQSHKLGFETWVPANSSRFFLSREEALIQPKAQVNLVYDLQEFYIRNSYYDPTLIRYDQQYCTSVTNLSIDNSPPTQKYFQEKITKFIEPNSLIIEIGCGQGEFVDFLTWQGYNVKGYDPVLRKQSRNLIKKYWDSKEPPADLFVLRCVLPHIQNPFDFLNEIALNSPNCKILIEYQNIKWAIENSLFYQISHDHVNLFMREDFENRYEIISEGRFMNNEWNWVLINPKNTAPPPTHTTVNFDYSKNPRELESIQNDFLSLMNCKEKFLESFKQSNIKAIWGAAGKGIVLSALLHEKGINVIVIDADVNRHSKFLEVSGFKCVSPTDGLRMVSKKDQILVVNPNHINEIRNYTDNERKLMVVNDLVNHL